jgi:hypothetical protein
LDQRRVRGNPVAFREQQDVPPDYLAAGDPQSAATTDDESAWAGEIPERRERALRAAVLV